MWLSLALVACVQDETVPPSPGEPADLCVEAGHVFDGTDGAARADRLLVVDGTTLVADEPLSDADGWDCGETIDARDAWVIPGLIDMHAHVTLNEADVSPMGWTPIYDAALSDWALRAMLAWGVTTARDLAGELPHVVDQRDAVAAGDRPGPELFVTGPAIEGSPSWFHGEMSRPVTSETEARAVVEELDDAGVDGIKLYGSLSPELTAAAIDGAHARGLWVAAHVWEATWIEAIDQEVDSLEHPIVHTWPGLDDADGADATATLDALVASGIATPPTLTSYAQLRPDAADDVPADVLALVPEAQLDAWDRALPRLTGGFDPVVYDAQLAASARWAERLHEAGATVLVGTDFATPYVVPGYGMHRELERLVDAGIPPEDVLISASRRGAEWLGIDDRTGTLVPGMEADLVVIDGDPLADISAVGQVRQVVSDGQVHTPDSLLAR